MIDWLSETLRAIIIIILFAAIIDLFVPSKTMQRYVKVVVSLFILMTILTPVLQLLRMEGGLQQLDGFAWPQSETLHAYTPLPEILQQGRELQTQNERESLERVQTQVETIIERDLERISGGMIVQVTADVVKEEETVYLRSVQIVQADPDEQAHIVDVQPVQVDIIARSSQQEDAEDGTVTTSLQAEKAQDVPGEAIMHYLQQQWNLPAEQVRFIASETDRG